LGELILAGLKVEVGMMRIDQVRILSDTKLNEEEENTYKELLNLRFKLATRQLNNPGELVEAKRTLARIKTIRREREIAGSIL
jgi:large subunit ribosomal protein L29